MVVWEKGTWYYYGMAQCAPGIYHFHQCWYHCPLLWGSGCVEGVSRWVRIWDRWGEAVAGGLGEERCMKREKEMRVSVCGRRKGNVKLSMGKAKQIENATPIRHHSARMIGRWSHLVQAGAVSTILLQNVFHNHTTYVHFYQMVVTC